MSEDSSPVGARRSRDVPTAVAAIWLASALVLAATLSTAFRVPAGHDLGTLLLVQGPRVGMAAGAGALLAAAGALRLACSTGRPLRELEWFAASAGVAAGGFGLAAVWSAAPALVAFALGGLLGGAILLAAARSLDRPRRATNLGALLLLALLILAAALAGTYARARRDVVRDLVAWLLGDLGHGTVAGGAALVAVAIGISAAGARAVAANAKERALGLAVLATAIGVGAAGPLAFVGEMVPRAVRRLAPIARPPVLVATAAVAGAATVAAIDAVPRLLVGGYDFPFNVPAALLAIPIYLGWNRARLRREAGPAPRWFETLELVAIVVATLAATALAAQLTAIVRSAT